ncbi:uncharacterized protein LOC118266224 [Spodoptera frugiperda]|uniref:Uncharacterized protein LOC118266224 n=1 Tax=Spodoptera frugiperda TaxID=7108 RepID=A0A9R0D010_SPOFR|nr:uncharacterized protein LOC118266224 [Spodoptera frugiperda]
MRVLILAALIAVAVAHPGLVPVGPAGPVPAPEPEAIPPIAIGPAVVDDIHPIAIGPAVVDDLHPIAIGPAVIDNLHPIAIGPAVIDNLHPISIGPAIIDHILPEPEAVIEPEILPDPVHIVPEPVVVPAPAPSPKGPLVQIILNINSVESAGAAVPVKPVHVVDEAPEPVHVVDEPEPVYIPPAVIGVPVLPQPAVESHQHHH